MTLATFQSKGTVSLQIAVLKILVNDSAITGTLIIKLMQKCKHKID